MPTSSASVEDLGQSKSKKEIVIRAFKQEWKVGRPWLVYEKGIMFCSICREAKLITAKRSEKTNAFIAGTDNIKLETIKLHEGTRQHQNASKEKKQRHACVEISSRKGVDVIKQNKAKQVRVKRCMCNTHAIMRHTKPFTDYVWMNRYIYAHSVAIFLRPPS